jgi:NADH-quinone oxidoreductase subunit C
MEQETIINALKDQYESDVVSMGMVDDIFTITLRNDRVAEIIRYLYFHKETCFQFLTSLCAVHYPDVDSIAVVYQLHNLEANVRIRIKSFLPVANPVIQTITDTFAGANWMERETYDFYGVIFKGHPDLRRILNVDDMIIFPMRKEYPLEDQTREDKQDSMFGR